jgi:hypothetical protein
MYFCIFTVINTSSNETTNNPPIPPYININKLIYFKQINYNIKTTMICTHLIISRPVFYILFK